MVTKKVLVTGGTGFLGAYILKNLVEKGYAVRAIRRSALLPFFIDKNILEKVEWVEGDVLDVVALNEAMQGMEAVVHAAAIVSFAKSNRKLMYKVNVDGTANVVNTAIENKVQRLLHVSSVAALGRSKQAETVTEQKQWDTNGSNTHYAVSKHLAEMQVWRGLAEGLEGVIINPSTILGFGNWQQSSCAIFKNVYNGFAWYTKGMNGFVGVQDAAEAAVRLLNSNIHQKKFIVSAENLRFQQLFNCIADGFGTKHPQKEATKFLGALAWRIEALKEILSGKKALLTKETAQIAQSQTKFCNEALLEALPGFEFTPVNEVIENACKKYLQALQAGILVP